MQESLPSYSRDADGERLRAKKESRKPSEYEAYWESLARDTTEPYADMWRKECRKAYLEQGVEFLVDVHDKGIDTMVFMDRSARPLAGFFHALWQRIYPNESAPAMRFMVSNRTEAKAPSPEKVRMVFNNSREAFNNKRVLLVDEAIDEGGTLKGAKQALRGAFPGIKEIIFGGMFFHTNFSNQFQRKVAIKPPRGSYYSQGIDAGQDANRTDSFRMARALGSKLYDKTDEVREVYGEPISRFQGQGSASKTTSYRLLLVGKHESLDRRSVDYFKQQLANVPEYADSRPRQVKILDALQKLLAS